MKRRAGLIELSILRPFLSNDLPSSASSPPRSLSFSLSAARKKKCHKTPRKSKWSTGVIQKSKKKKQATVAASSSSSSSTSSRAISECEGNAVAVAKVANGFADLSSCAASESSDGEHSQLTATMNGHHQDFPGVTATQHGVLMNGYHHPEPRDPQTADSVPTRGLDVRRPTGTSKAPPNPETMVNGVCLSKLGLYASQQPLTLLY